jgi:hypothetical protein
MKNVKFHSTTHLTSISLQNICKFIIKYIIPHVNSMYLIINLLIFFFKKKNSKFVKKKKHISYLIHHLRWENIADLSKGSTLGKTLSPESCISFPLKTPGSFTLAVSLWAWGLGDLESTAVVSHYYRCSNEWFIFFWAYIIISVKICGSYSLRYRE